MITKNIQYEERYKKVTGKRLKVKKIMKFFKEIEIFEEINNVMDI